MHELAHAITPTLLGFKATKRTLQRAYIENQPTTCEEIKESSNKFKYGMIAMSGSLITILFGYILLYIAHNLRSGMELISFLCWYFTLIIFLIEVMKSEKLNEPSNNKHIVMVLKEYK